jgi:hypothetical protein
MVEAIMHMAMIGFFVNLINLLFTIGLLGLTASVVVLLFFKIFKRAQILIPKIGIIIFLIPLLITVIARLYLGTPFIEEDVKLINTKTKIYWKKDYDKSIYDYFTYNHKNYIFFEPQLNNVPDIIEVDRPVANIRNKSRTIIEIINTKQEINIFTINNYPDDSLLIIRWRYGPIIYCDENQYEEKINFYENIENYKCFASYDRGNESGYWSDNRFVAGGHYWENSLNRLELFDIDTIKEIDSYSEGDYIEFPFGGIFDEIYIYGLSKDGVMEKKIANIIIFNEQVYKILFNNTITYLSNDNNKIGIHVKLLNDEISEYIRDIM